METSVGSPEPTTNVAAEVFATVENFKLELDAIQNAWPLPDRLHYAVNDLQNAVWAALKVAAWELGDEKISEVQQAWHAWLRHDGMRLLEATEVQS